MTGSDKNIRKKILRRLKILQTETQFDNKELIPILALISFYPFAGPVEN